MSQAQSEGNKVDERKLYPSEKQDRLIVRFPDGMREKIGALARANGRSMNAEVIDRLQRTLVAEPGGDGADKTEAGLKMLSEIHEMVSKLFQAKTQSTLSQLPPLKK